MPAWQPPIPAGALYSKAARAVGPAIALLGYCYDLVDRDGWFTISLKSEASSDLDEAYPTVKRWWQALEAGPFFSEVQKHGRNGMRVRFKDAWLDWRVLQARSTPTAVNGTDTGSEMIPNTPENDKRDINGITNGTDTGSEMIPNASGIKVLMTTDQASDHEALNAPRKEPEKRKSRDPNQQHPACLLFFEKTGYRPNREQAAQIAATVIDFDQWAVAVKAWLAQGNRINDAKGMLDWYLDPSRMERKTNGHKNGYNGRQPANAVIPDRPVSRGQADFERDYLAKLAREAGEPLPDL